MRNVEGVELDSERRRDRQNKTVTRRVIEAQGRRGDGRKREERGEEKRQG